MLSLSKAAVDRLQLRRRLAIGYCNSVPSLYVTIPKNEVSPTGRGEDGVELYGKLDRSVIVTSLQLQDGGCADVDGTGEEWSS
jgi:hypothetical protein